MSWEYTLRKRSYTDQIPVHLGAWILATSKLHLLEVRVFFLHFLIHCSNIIFKTLSALDNHIGHMHYKLLYVDTGLFNFSWIFYQNTLTRLDLHCYLCRHPRADVKKE